MTKNRLEAFSDGVIAIIITIMVLELKPPADATMHALEEHGHVFISYVLSFVFLAIYWNNHHHMLHSVRRVERANPVGQRAPVVLAVAHAIRDGLDRQQRTLRRFRRPATASCCCSRRSRTTSFKA